MSKVKTTNYTEEQLQGLLEAAKAFDIRACDLSIPENLLKEDWRPNRSQNAIECSKRKAKKTGKEYAEVQFESFLKSRGERLCPFPNNLPRDADESLKKLRQKVYKKVSKNRAAVYDALKSEFAKMAIPDSNSNNNSPARPGQGRPPLSPPRQGGGDNPYWQRTPESSSSAPHGYHTPESSTRARRMSIYGTDFIGQSPLEVERTRQYELHLGERAQAAADLAEERARNERLLMNERDNMFRFAQLYTPNRTGIPPTIPEETTAPIAETPVPESTQAAQRAGTHGLFSPQTQVNTNAASSQATSAPHAETGGLSTPSTPQQSFESRNPSASASFGTATMPTPARNPVAFGAPTTPAPAQNPLPPFGTPMASIPVPAPHSPYVGLQAQLQPSQAAPSPAAATASGSSSDSSMPALGLSFESPAFQKMMREYLAHHGMSNLLPPDPSLGSTQAVGMSHFGAPAPTPSLGDTHAFGSAPAVASSMEASASAAPSGGLQAFGAPAPNAAAPSSTQPFGSSQEAAPATSLGGVQFEAPAPALSSGSIQPSGYSQYRAPSPAPSFGSTQPFGSAPAVPSTMQESASAAPAPSSGSTQPFGSVPPVASSTQGSASVAPAPFGGLQAFGTASTVACSTQGSASATPASSLGGKEAFPLSGVKLPPGTLYMKGLQRHLFKKAEKKKQQQEQKDQQPPPVAGGNQGSRTPLSFGLPPAPNPFASAFDLDKRKQPDESDPSSDFDFKIPKKAKKKKSSTSRLDTLQDRMYHKLGIAPSHPRGETPSMEEVQQMAQMFGVDLAGGSATGTASGEAPLGEVPPSIGAPPASSRSSSPTDEAALKDGDPMENRSQDDDECNP